jgi:hypothetical protein
MFDHAPDPDIDNRHAHQTENDLAQNQVKKKMKRLVRRKNGHHQRRMMISRGTAVQSSTNDNDNVCREGSCKEGREEDKALNRLH